MSTKRDDGEGPASEGGRSVGVPTRAVRPLVGVLLAVGLTGPANTAVDVFFPSGECVATAPIEFDPQGIHRARLAGELTAECFDRVLDVSFTATVEVDLDWKGWRSVSRWRLRILRGGLARAGGDLRYRIRRLSAAGRDPTPGQR